ncbi:hypothetical protein [Sorlinia euscelidii]|uniref:hypothetical protein n=1 Tax=Sorlinia euscelidii TaxID=3081148 RepID=UPI003AABF6E6
MEDVFEREQRDARFRIEFHLQVWTLSRSMIDKSGAVDWGLAFLEGWRKLLQRAHGRIATFPGNGRDRTVQKPGAEVGRAVNSTFPRKTSFKGRLIKRWRS